MAFDDIRAMKLFAPLTDDECAQMAPALTRMELPAGATVLQAGEPSDSLYFIQKGSVRVLTAVTGRRVSLATLGATEHFGDMAIVDGGGVSASVEAVEPVVLWVLSRKDFGELSKNATLAYKLWRALAETLTDRTRSTNRALAHYVKLNRHILDNETFRELYKLCHS